MARRRNTAIPNPPATADSAIQRWMQQVKEALEVFLGHRGDSLDRGVTFRDLNTELNNIDLSGISVPVPEVDWPNPGDAGIPSTPPQPTSVSFSWTTSTVYITWANVSIFWNGLQYGMAAEIWRSPRYTSAGAASAAVVAGASFVGQTSEFGIYADPVEPGGHYKYWIRFKYLADNTHGEWHDLNGTVVSVSQDPTVLLDMLDGHITQGHLAGALSVKIDKVDDNEVAIQAVADDLNAEYTLRIDNGGYVAGFGLANNGPGSSQFIVRADHFAIQHPTTDGNNTTIRAIPFHVNAGKVVMDTAYIANATITNAHINDVAVDKITGNVGNFITANIQNASIETAHIQDTAITNAKIANIDGAKITNATISGAKIINSTIDGTNHIINQTVHGADKLIPHSIVYFQQWTHFLGNFGYSYFVNRKYVDVILVITWYVPSSVTASHKFALWERDHHYSFGAQSPVKKYTAEGLAGDVHHTYVHRFTRDDNSTTESNLIVVKVGNMSMDVNDYNATVLSSGTKMSIAGFARYR